MRDYTLGYTAPSIGTVNLRWTIEQAHDTVTSLIHHLAVTISWIPDCRIKKHHKEEGTDNLSTSSINPVPDFQRRHGPWIAQLSYNRLCLSVARDIFTRPYSWHPSSPEFYSRM